MKSTPTAVSTARQRIGKQDVGVSTERAPYTLVSFEDVNREAKEFAALIEEKKETLTDILLGYESFEVVEDETARTLDLLNNLEENGPYFQLRVNEVTSFLPRNQPLYAFTCFVIIPSWMAHEVHFRIPHSMRDFFSEMMEVLEVKERFPNVIVSDKQRLEFLRERSALRVNPETKETIPVTDAVIFTGTSAHAEQLRVVFDNRTLFILNGAGHNPVVVCEDADISAAVDAALTLQLYNQGQDCAAPNSILVHKHVYPEFLKTLRERLKKVRIGAYRDRSSRVGPISKPEDLVRIQDFFVHNQRWLDETTQGIIRARDVIIEPTIICKPLKEGGNFEEIFAPVFFLQEYERDSQLALYFETPQYAQNAMFITLYGNSGYINGLIDRQFDGAILHDEWTVLRNTHPHAKGVERGTQPYGGYGCAASRVSVNGKTICKPTLPQRDIHEWVVQPLLKYPSLATYREKFSTFTQVQYKNVEKLLRLMAHGKGASTDIVVSGATYVDVPAIVKETGSRYAKVDERYAYRLLDRPNVDHIIKLQLTDIEHIRALQALVRRRGTLSENEFTTELYALPAKADATQKENQKRQLDFFQHIYQLLFGKISGPRLPQFLLDADIAKLQELLDV